MQNKKLYRIEDLKKYVNKDDKKNSSRTNLSLVKNKISINFDTKVPERFLMAIEKDKHLKSVYLGNINAGSGSEIDFVLSVELFIRKYSIDEIVAIVQSTEYKKNNKRTKKYFESTLSKAKKYLNDNVNLKNNQNEIGINIKQLSDWDKLMDLCLDLKNINYEDTEFIIDTFLIKNDLLLIPGKTGNGKSRLAYSLAKKIILDTNYYVFYVDADMARKDISKRINNAELNIVDDNRFKYLEANNVGELRVGEKKWNLMISAIKNNENHCVVIIDNLKALCPSRCDLNSDTDMSEVMHQYKRLRDAGATVIIIHHLGKENNSYFKNSGTIADDVDTVFTVVKYDKKNSIIELEAHNTRNSDLAESIAFKIEENYDLKIIPDSKTDTLIELTVNIHTKLIEMKNDNIINTKKEIMELFPDQSKNNISDILQRGLDILWNKSKGNRNSHYYNPNEIDPKNKISLIEKDVFGILT